MPIQAPLISKGTWGETYVFPRDTANGLEDSKLEKWCYWDGKIVKDDIGKYHIYASRWPQSVSHSQGWHVNSTAMHAISDNPIGPYVDTGVVCPEYKEGKGHNVVGLRTKDGKYAVIKSSLIQGSIFLSDKPEGPFKFAGEIKVDLNGHSKNDAYLKSGRMDNVDILLRPDGRYMLVGRPTVIMISESDDITGPYKIISDRVKNHPDLPKSKLEDPSIWYSGGMYHMVINHHTTNTTYHMSSIDGINDWKFRGIAFGQQHNIFKYTDGTVNKWTVIQRMTVYVEDGHPTHFIFSVIDTKKGEDRPNDQNGSKIVVVPFDGVAFDKHMQELVKEEAKNKKIIKH
ncbi:hypothetical protein GCM10022396_36240 [Flavivirga amylovorans]